MPAEKARRFLIYAQHRHERTQGLFWDMAEFAEARSIDPLWESTPENNAEADKLIAEWSDAAEDVAAGEGPEIHEPVTC